MSFRKWFERGQLTTSIRHGFLIPPIAAYLAWQRRHRFLAAPLRPSAAGLLVLGGSVIVLALGIFGGKPFLARLSLVGGVTAGVLLLCGWSRLRAIAFPLAVLLLMIPLPSTVVNQIEPPLQILTAQFAKTAMHAVTIPVLRDGNLLVMANATLEVAKECSGIRSLISLLILGVVFGYGPDSRVWGRGLMVAAAIPVVLIANGTRVAVTGVAVHFYGVAAAQGFFHELLGWLAFALAFAMMLLFHRLLLLVAPDRSPAPTSPTVAPAA